MRKWYSSLLFLLFVVFSVSTISDESLGGLYFFFHDHNHDHNTDTLNHVAPLDANGCHVGPSGFHCHR